jgi:hypothetical protein
VQHFYFIFLIALMITACELPFQTREPEEPISDQSSWIQPTSPHYVMTNLRNAISEKNIANYMRCLADTSQYARPFRFLADPAVANRNPSLFAYWGKEEEITMMNQLLLFLPKDSLSVVKFTLQSETNLVDSVILVQDYDLDIHHNCKETDCPRHMQGQSEFRLLKNNQDLWTIYRWNDSASGDEPSWSALKAHFGK